VQEVIGSGSREVMAWKGETNQRTNSCASTARLYELRQSRIDVDLWCECDTMDGVNQRAVTHRASGTCNRKAGVWGGGLRP